MPRTPAEPARWGSHVPEARRALAAVKREESRPRVPGSAPSKRQQQKTHWLAMLARGDALADAVESALALDGPLDYDTRRQYLGALRDAARAWRESR